MFMAQIRIPKHLNFLNNSQEMDFESDDTAIIGGDFNIPLDPVKDKKGGNSTSTSNQFD